MTAQTVAFLYCGIALGLAGIVALVRMERGPSMLDRVVALDVITAVVLGVVAVISAAEDRSDLLPVLVVLAVVGFVGSVTIARFVPVDRPDEARILSREELRELLAAQQSMADEDAPVHDPDAADLRERGYEDGLPGGPAEEEERTGVAGRAPGAGPVDGGTPRGGPVDGGGAPRAEPADGGPVPRAEPPSTGPTARPATEGER
ncbi:monovalent cation/H+ antiporter complex subunit F [Georgenia sp. TF02-10]|uniref:monovalent cation/H+ antiporter complex subunit F n=1 Tax=Georgenia sp. TF02-10 TaxID=2917725 RepID=UPI001FA75171|nr:monovalent cation/H+ antiporter complex subunit F [Georgenia sp. TF02-10]UNX54671.1 monovalent cation/H+ antiporter complex subunit F [Georgenia sp. TF02-10]